jgi:hypothetical protein
MSDHILIVGILGMFVWATVGIIYLNHRDGLTFLGFIEWFKQGIKGNSP